MLKFLLGIVLAFCGFGLTYYLLYSGDLPESQPSANIPQPALELTSVQAVSNSFAQGLAASSKAPDQNQISHKTVDVPEGALPMETMISKFMAERQRAAKEAVELNPFGSNSGVK